MSIVGGLAMNAFIGASKDFNDDKKKIESSQNLSAILEMIGNDIKQAGEGINDGNFPVIEFSFDSANTTASTAVNTDSPQQSSKIIIRRAISPQLTLCEPSFAPTTATSIIVADNLTATVNATNGANCDVGTSSSPLSVYRVATTVTAPAPPTTVPVTLPPTITTYYPQAAGSFNPYPTTPAPLVLKLPLALRKARDYRCNTDPNTIYDSAANAGADFCASVPNAKLRIAVSNSNGQILIFNQTGEVASATADTTVKLATDITSTKRYQITLGNSAAVPPIPVVPTDAVAKNAINSVSTVTYPIGSPIYLIEERVYALDNNGNLTLAINGGDAQTLIKKISQFNISARLYTNTVDRTVNPTPTVPAVTAPATTISNTNFVCPTGSNQPTTTDATPTNPQYVCQFNYNTRSTDVPMNWKQLAGVRVSLQARYDGTGQSATASATDKAKLQAVAEFFPRNVLSK